MKKDERKCATCKQCDLFIPNPPYRLGKCDNPKSRQYGQTRMASIVACVSAVNKPLGALK